MALVADVFVKRKGWGGVWGGFLWWICPGVKFTRLACVEIREAYLFKASTETMLIEGLGRGGGNYMSIWSIAREEGGEGGKEKGAKQKRRREELKVGKKVSEMFVCQWPYQKISKISEYGYSSLRPCDHVTRTVARRRPNFNQERTDESIFCTRLF